MARTGYDFQSLTQENRDWKEARAMSKEIIQFDQAMFETKLDAMVRDKVERIVNAMLDEYPPEHRRRIRTNNMKDRKHVPSSTFLATPYSRVGLNEREAKAAGLDYVVKRLPVAAVPKAQVMRRPDGLMKAIVERNTGRILGAMLLSVESHEVINIVKLAMDLDAPASTLRDMVFTHPTIAEALNDLFA